MASIPSIATIPSGYKATKLYSVLPVDGSADLTFARSGSATRVANNGIVETMATDVPRLDYSDGGCPSLLLEPQRRNLIPYSADFTQTDWTSGSTATLTANYGVAPDGSTSSVLVTNSGGGGSEQLAEVVTVTSGETYTVSFWVKRVTGSGVVNIVAIENTATPIAVTSEWQRFSVTATATSTLGRAYVRIETAGDEVEVWGAQLEDNGVLGGGDYMTSYIPTNGATATRIAETCTKSGLGSYINSSEGVLYFEGRFLNDEYSSFNGVYLRESASINNSVQFRNDLNNPNSIQFYVFSGGVEQASVTYAATDITQNFKFAFKYELDNVKVYFNGSEILSDTSATMPIGLTDLRFVGGGFRTKDLRVYDTALTDAELTTLTTL